MFILSTSLDKVKLCWEFSEEVFAFLMGRDSGGKTLSPLPTVSDTDMTRSCNLETKKERPRELQRCWPWPHRSTKTMPSATGLEEKKQSLLLLIFRNS